MTLKLAWAHLQWHLQPFAGKQIRSCFPLRKTDAAESLGLPRAAALSKIQIGHLSPDPTMRTTGSECAYPGITSWPDKSEKLWFLYILKACFQNMNISEGIFSCLTLYIWCKELQLLLILIQLIFAPVVQLFFHSDSLIYLLFYTHSYCVYG